MKRKVLIAIPERLLDQADLLANFRSQTRSELIREALRTHIERSQTFASTGPVISLLPRSLPKEEAIAN